MLKLRFDRYINCDSLKLKGSAYTSRCHASAVQEVCYHLLLTYTVITKVQKWNVSNDTRISTHITNLCGRCSEEEVILLEKYQEKCLHDHQSEVREENTVKENKTLIEGPFVATTERNPGDITRSTKLTRTFYAQRFTQFSPKGNILKHDLLSFLSLIH